MVRACHPLLARPRRPDGDLDAGFRHSVVDPRQPVRLCQVRVARRRGARGRLARARAACRLDPPRQSRRRLVGRRAQGRLGRAGWRPRAHPALASRRGRATVGAAGRGAGALPGGGWRRGGGRHRSRRPRLPRFRPRRHDAAGAYWRALCLGARARRWRRLVRRDRFEGPPAAPRGRQGPHRRRHRREQSGLDPRGRQRRRVRGWRLQGPRLSRLRGRLAAHGLRRERGRDPRPRPRSGRRALRGGAEHSGHDRG